ncbi:MAG: hypothetical protein JWN06_3507 [Propionibacteriaceae bacterium]|nr:hypothetical protein [Propionibacteriaceae bacterium]
MADPLSVASAIFAGVATGLAVRSPPQQLGRLRSGVTQPSSRTGLARLLDGRLDAPSWRRRTVVAAPVGAAVLVLAGRSGMHPLWPAATAAAVLTAALMIGLGWLESSAAKARRQQLVADLPQALELMAAALAAGAPLRRAVAAVVEVFDGPVADDLGQVLAAVDLGVADAQAWRDLATSPAWSRVASDIARSAESGTMMVETLRQHASRARADRRAQLEIAAKSVGVRSVLPLMLCFMPAFILIGIVPTVSSALLTVLR